MSVEGHMLIEDFLAAVGDSLQQYCRAFTDNGYGDTVALARSSTAELTRAFERVGVAEAHRRLIEETLAPLHRQARAELPPLVAATPLSMGCGAGADKGIKTYDAIFDRMERELGVDLVRVATDGRLRLEVRKVVSGSMAEEAKVQMYDELVAYRAAGIVGAAGWHKIGFTRPTEDFMREVGDCHRPLSLRFRRGRIHGRPDPSASLQAARRRHDEQTHERARVAAAGFMGRPVPQLLPTTERGRQRFVDADTRGRRVALLMCDACLTQYLRAGTVEEEAKLLKKQRRARANTDSSEQGQSGKVGAGSQPITPARPRASKGSRTKGKSNGNRRLPRVASLAVTAAQQGLKNMDASEERAVARAMAGEAVRYAVFLQHIHAKEAARQDATEFRRHRLPGIRRLGPPLTPLPELRTWLKWQLLGLSPTAGIQQKRQAQKRHLPRGDGVHGFASIPSFTGSYTGMDADGAKVVEIERGGAGDGTAARAAGHGNIPTAAGTNEGEGKIPQEEQAATALDVSAASHGGDTGSGQHLTPRGNRNPSPRDGKATSASQHAGAICINIGGSVGGARRGAAPVPDQPTEHSERAVPDGTQTPAGRRGRGGRCGVGGDAVMALDGAGSADGQEHDPGAHDGTGG